MILPCPTKPSGRPGCHKRKPSPRFQDGRASARLLIQARLYLIARRPRLRDALIDRGLAARIVVRGEDGWQAATYAGRDAYTALYPGPDGPADTMAEARANRTATNVMKRTAKGAD